jgi:Ser/Thr protein kinase RdoA (MazF antagonist)
MEDSHKQLSDDALAVLAPRYGIDPPHICTIGHAGSDIREFWRHGVRYLIRLSRCDHRTIDLLRAEIDWISYLDANGISVSVAVPSEAGETVEAAEIRGVRFAGVVFKAAEGRPPVDFVDEWDETFYWRWGHLVGRMHKLTKAYLPPSGIQPRPNWHETDDIAVDKYVPASEGAVLRNCHALLDCLRQLPTGPQSYGLIHADLHRRNLFVKDDMFTVIDFEASQYNWFVYDIAVCLYHAVIQPPSGMTRSEFGEHFMEHFMTAYRTANSLSGEWLRKIPLFLKLRRIVMYVDVLRYWDLEHLSAERQRFLEELRLAIEHGRPVI